MQRKAQKGKKDSTYNNQMKARDGTEGTSHVTESEDKDGEATPCLPANPEQTHDSHRDL